MGDNDRTTRHQSNMTGWEWLINHTIFGPPVEYIPRENYENIFGVL